MLGAGTIINPIIKIVTTVAILAAVGIFIVKPVLDTTEDAIDKGIEHSRQIQEGVQQNISEAQIDSARTQIAARITGLASSWPEAARELRSCAQDAGRDGLELERCQRFATRVSGMQSDRNFATSYASTLQAQGDTSAADRIEKCVEDAGFEPGPMRRCRDLADELLFG